MIIRRVLVLWISKLSPTAGSGMPLRDSCSCLPTCNTSWPRYPHLRIESPFVSMKPFLNRPIAMFLPTACLAVGCADGASGIAEGNGHHDAQHVGRFVFSTCRPRHFEKVERADFLFYTFIQAMLWTERSGNRCWIPSSSRLLTLRFVNSEQLRYMLHISSHVLPFLLPPCLADDPEVLRHVPETERPNHLFNIPRDRSDPIRLCYAQGIQTGHGATEDVYSVRIIIRI